MKREKSNIIKYPKQFQIKIGVVVFGIIFIYVIFHIFSYLTADNITIYEVTQGTIASNNEYRALAIRQETVMNADRDGSIYYYAQNVHKVGVKSLLYSIDSDGGITSKLTKNNSDITSLDTLEQANIEGSIQSFMNDYNGNDFSKLYSFKNELSSTLEQLYSMHAIDDLGEDVAKASESGTFQLYYDTQPGVIVYGTDGLESITMDNYEESNFDVTKLDTKAFKNNDQVINGQPIYKLITSDDWNLVIPITKKKVAQFKDQEYIKIRFKEDNATTWAKCNVKKKAGNYYLELTLDDSMERYATSRFINIELLITETSGLKIQNSAIVSKEFYVVPESYFTNGDSKDLLVKKKDGESTMISPDIYFEDDEKGVFYIDSDEINDDSILTKSDSNDTYRLGSQKGSLSGVYNVNKGYAVFKQIEPIYENEDYTIVKTGTAYGIALYDHIVLQGNLVKEDQIIN